MQVGYYAQDRRTNINTLYTSVKVHCNKTCMIRQQRDIWAHRSKNTDPRTQIHALEYFIVKKCMEWSWSALLCLVDRLNVTKNNLYLLWLRSRPSFQSCHSTRATAKADVKLPGYIVPSSEICNSYVSPIPLCLDCNYHTFSWCGR